MTLLRLFDKIKKIIRLGYARSLLDKIVVNLGTRQKVYDTPGIINKHSLLLYLAENNKNTPTKQPLKPITFQLSAEQTIFYEGLVIFSYLTGLKTIFHFYKNNNLKLHRTKLSNKDYYFTQHAPTAVVRLKIIRNEPNK